LSRRRTLHEIAPDFRWTLQFQGVEKYFPVCALASRVLRHRTRTMQSLPVSFPYR